MKLRIKPHQMKEVHHLVRRQCANYVSGNCLLLSYREESKCVQLLSRYGIYCRYFLESVLPGNQKLHNEILNHKGVSF